MIDAVLNVVAIGLLSAAILVGQWCLLDRIIAREIDENVEEVVRRVVREEIEKSLSDYLPPLIRAVGEIAKATGRHG